MLLFGGGCVDDDGDDDFSQISVVIMTFAFS